MIKVYHIGNGIFYTSEFLNNLLKKQQTLMFSGVGISYQNWAAKHAIKMIFTAEMTILMYNMLRCSKETFCTQFGQWKWNMLYGSKVGSLICNMVYKLLVKVETYMFWSQFCRSLKLKPLNGIQGFKERLIWDFSRFTQHKLGWFWTWWMLQYHCSFILFWYYFIYCCENHSPRSVSLDKSGQIKELSYPGRVNPIKWSSVGWQMVELWWAVSTF